MPAQFFLFRYQAVNRKMAVPADVNGGLHLLTRESFLKPTISVAPARNQVMFSGAFF